MEISGLAVGLSLSMLGVILVLAGIGNSLARIAAALERDNRRD